MTKKELIGFACAYTPLALIDAAGFTPYRLLPEDKSPDQAGRILHDNLCPHVKRILDRAVDGNIPDLAAMVIMNSCDAMRRLHDAWRRAVPGIPSILVDLPVTPTESAVGFFRNELQRLVSDLARQGGKSVGPEGLASSIALYNDVADKFDRLQQKVLAAKLQDGSAALQALYNRASCESPDAMLEVLKTKLAEPDSKPSGDDVPIYLFGNMMPDPAVFELFESCGARIVAEDMCTGSRLFFPIEPDARGEVLESYAAGLLNRRPCARTFSASDPGKMAGDVVAAANRHAVRAVIGYTVKFCDPYVARLPGIRDALKKEGLPFLLLEGDCTLHSIGQQKTRIEAFVEMLR